MSSSVIAEKYAHELHRTIEAHCETGLYEALQATKLGMSKLNHGAITGLDNLKITKIALENFDKALQTINKKLGAKSASLGISLAQIIRGELELLVNTKTSADHAVSTLAVLQDVGKFIETTMDALDYIEQIKGLLNPGSQARVPAELRSGVTELYKLVSHISIELQKILASVITDSDNSVKAYIYKFVHTWIHAAKHRYDFSLDTLHELGLKKNLD